MHRLLWQETEGSCIQQPVRNEGLRPLPVMHENPANSQVSELGRSFSPVKHLHETEGPVNSVTAPHERF